MSKSVRSQDKVSDEHGILKDNSRHSPIFEDLAEEDIRDRDLIDHNVGERGSKVNKKQFKSQDKWGKSRKLTSSGLYNRPGTEGGVGNNFKDLQKCLAMYQVYGNEKMAIVNPMTRPKIIQVKQLDKVHE